mmetsp:Transcript_2708/g.4033  ORF Transcript_2708/g.4033 Transcript_2708/m.4033 type:complete len:92 (+) Transcript_2708:202-477(+)
MIVQYDTYCSHRANCFFLFAHHKIEIFSLFSYSSNCKMLLASRNNNKGNQNANVDSVNEMEQNDMLFDAEEDLCAFNISKCILDFILENFT